MITLSQLRNWNIVANDGTIPDYPGLSMQLCQQIIRDVLQILNAEDIEQYLAVKSPRGRKFVIIPDDVIYHLIRKVKDMIYDND